MTFYDVLIVGAGHGGAQAGLMLRQQNFQGTVALLGDEPDAPYERPPLSKDYFTGERTFKRILIRPIESWADRNIELLLNRRVIAVDAALHQVVLADKTKLGYGRLIWAAGGTARRLECEGSHFSGIHTMRTRSDVDRISVELRDTKKVVVVGGGYIGLESAAALTKLGKHVTVLEALPRVLARVAGEPLSRFFESQHRAHGVDVRVGETVERVLGSNGHTEGVRLASQEIVAAEIIIVGIGIVPEVGPLLEAGAEGGNGVEVDELCRTSLVDIFAIGDCASHSNRYAGGRRVRLESVQNAIDQANVVARAIAGSAVPYDAVPTFWSNQYDLKLQTVGLSTGFDETVVRGELENRRFSVIYLKQGRVIALDCVNVMRDYVQGRALVASSAAAEARGLADSTLPLNEWLA